MISTLIRSSSILAIVSAGLLALGCGPSTPPAEHAHGEHGEHEHGEHAKHEHEHGEHGEHGKGEHPKLAGAMHELHEVLAPLWHAEKGPERAKKTCEAVPAFEQHSAAVDKDAPADAAHHTAAQGLVASVGELKTECAKPEAGRADFEAKFKAMHEAFHKVMESGH